MDRPPDDVLVPLRQWMADEAARAQLSAGNSVGGQLQLRKATLLRKSTVAYGMAELVRHARSHPGAHHPQNNSTVSVNGLCEIDNFSVRLSQEKGASSKHIAGVEMTSPPLAVHIAEPSFLRSSFADIIDVDEEETAGRYLEVEFSSNGKFLPEEDGGGAAAVSQSEEDERCHFLGAALYELFSRVPLSVDAGKSGGEDSEAKIHEEPARKKAKADPSRTPFVPLMGLGFPSSLCLLVKNLLECREEDRPDHAYESIDAVIKDLHLLLLDPGRFLFDQETNPVKLSFREHKLYGRENEVTEITDAFCRVSCGKSEAFFIGGFSGSGKSMLVNSLTAQVDGVEGYVITHKFDQMSKERPLLEVISVFNELCLVVKEKSSQKELLSTMSRLMDVFGSDFSLLARLLPNIERLAPELKGTGGEKGGGDHMNLRSVCFILQRFMRVVSSKVHPVMLFLDDLQWSDSSALSLVEGILCDSIGSSCLFFVGSYRSNEVDDDHDLFRFMSSVESVGVPTTKLSLEGLIPADLNAMISDALCTFPRICEPLSDIVYQKTKGNPYFVLEFLRSLVEGGLLEYNAQKKQWEWDEDRISSMDVTGNVLYLLSTKMSGLSDDIQVALKVAACFGIKISESIVGHLCSNTAYKNIRAGLEQAVQQGFMIQIGTADYKFVHDKVREAAYSLIPDEEKKKAHYNLGMILYSATKGIDDDEVLFSTVAQINHGLVDSKELTSGLKLELADLMEVAGLKAVERSDFVTARSYLNSVLSLLPSDHWTSHYDRSLRLYFLSAKTVHACGDVEKAYEVLQTITSKARCLLDKLDAYHMIVVILNDREAIEESYTTAYEVLLQLGEEIPGQFAGKETKEMVKETAGIVKDLTEDTLLGMRELDRTRQYILKFYLIITIVSFYAKPAMVPFFTCRMVQISMKYGICKYTLTGLVQFAGMSCSNIMIRDIKGAIRIGKMAMSAMKRRFGSSTETLPNLHLAYYGFVSVFCDPVQSTLAGLCRAFETGIAIGDTSTGFVNAIHHIRISLIAGTALPTVLKRLEYYVEEMRRYGNTFAKTHLDLYRDTALLLMASGSNSSDYSQVQENAMLKFPPETTYYHKALRAFWIGHSERCHHFIEKLFQGVSGSGGRHHRAFLMLYYGLNSYKVIRRTSPAKLKAVPHKALEALKTAAEYSHHNFDNKVFLLEAEIASNDDRSEDAKASYEKAISASRSSGFTHEHALSCELAGFHHKMIGDHRNAWGYFSQAKELYAEWGCQTKVESVRRQLESFQISLVGTKTEE